MGSYDLSVEYDEKEKQFSELIMNHFLIEQEILILGRSILELTSRKQDLRIAKAKASHLVRQCRIEMDLIKSKYFRDRSVGV
jgi:hypothetical protein